MLRARKRALLVLVHRAEDLHGSTNASSLMYTCKTMYESPGVNRTCIWDVCAARFWMHIYYICMYVARTLVCVNVYRYTLLYTGHVPDQSQLLSTTGCVRLDEKNRAFGEILQVAC